MKTLNRLVIQSFILAIILFAGCNKEDDDNNSSTNGYKEPSITKSEDIIAVREDMENNSNLGGINSLVGSFNGLCGSFNSYFNDIPSDAIYTETKSSIRSWTWSAGGIYIKIDISEISTYTTWKLYINGLLRAEVTEYSEKYKGTYKFYDGGIAKITFNWEQSGVLNDETFLLVGEDKTYFVRQISSTADFSGRFDAYEGSSEAEGGHFGHIQWTATGASSGWVKNLATGQTVSFPQ